MIPVRQIVQKIIQVPQFIEKIVETKQQDVKIQYIEKIVEKIVIDERIKQIQKIVPYIQQVIKQIPTIVQKIVIVESKVQQIITAQQIVEKVVQKTKTVSKIVEIQKQVPKLIQVPKIIQIDRIIPQIIRVNQYIQKVVEKIVQVPRIIQKIRQIQVQKQKIVQVNNVFTEIKQVQRIVQKIAILEQMKQVIKNVNHIEKVIRIVEQIQRVPVQITIKEQILVEIPYILEKIVEKIVVMPQIVEVLKYIHQISESNELLTVQSEKQYQNQQLKLLQLTKNMKPSIQSLLRQLRSLRNDQQFSGKIETIERFLAQFEKLIAFPKLIRIQGKDNTRATIIQKQKIVKVPVQDQHSLRKQLSMSILIQKLIMQLKRLTSISKLPLQLDDEIKMIFFAQLRTQNRYNIQGELKDKFNQFSIEINRKFESLGPWAQQHQLMLNTILEQRFKLAQIIQDANLQIQRSKQQYNNLMTHVQSESFKLHNCQQRFNKLKQIFSSYSSSKQQQLTQIRQIIQSCETLYIQRQQMKRNLYNETNISMGDDTILESYQSKLRERQVIINKLKDDIQKMRRSGGQIGGQIGQIEESKLMYNQDYVKGLERTVDQYRKNQSRSDIESTKADISKLQSSYRQHLLDIQKRNQQLEQEKSDLRNSLENTKRQLRVIHENQRFLMRRDDKHKIQQPEWKAQRIPQYSAESLSHSQIKKLMKACFHRVNTAFITNTNKEILTIDKVHQIDYKNHHLNNKENSKLQ